MPCPDPDDAISDAGLDATRPAATPEDEARRLLTLCIVCKYCNGYCDVFRAADRRPDLAPGDLAYLASLCHHCRTCWGACQYRPPHAFAVNLPQALARLRLRVWHRLVWGDGLGGRLAARAARPAVQAVLGLGPMLLLPLFVLLVVPGEALMAGARGAEEAFYAVVPKPLMVGGALAAFGLPLALILRGMVRFWRAVGGGTARQVWRALPLALADLLALRQMSGGGGGCTTRDGAFSHAKRWAHQGVVLGFGLTFVATLASAARQYLGGLPSPAPLVSAPVLLGTAGGLLMLAGAVGLIRHKRGADPEPNAPETGPAERLLLTQLLALAASGLALLAGRETAAMAPLLALHLGAVLGFCLTLPFGKLLHAPFRALALVRSAIERQAAAETRQRHRDE